MGKTKTMQYISTFTALALVTLFLAAGLLMGAAAPGTTDAHQVQAEEEMLQFGSGGHVLGFGANAVYLAGLDHALKVEFAGGSSVTPFAESSVVTANALPELGRVIYSDAWEKIDVIFSAAAGGIAESTYVIHPGGDPADIKLSYNVPVEIMQEGGLSFYFESGYMTESAPIAWQEIDGRHVAVSVQFERQAENLVGFSLGSYDPVHSVYIDPVYQWHTFYGSTGSDDYGYGIALDSAGGVYVVGSSPDSWNGPGGESPLNPHGGGYSSIVIVKLDSAGAYQWHTFYGSTDRDYGYGIAVDSSGNVYVSGESYDSWGSPLNPHAGGGNSDLVIVKLDSAGAYQWHPSTVQQIMTLATASRWTPRAMST
jgi:hypothetical protein